MSRYIDAEALKRKLLREWVRDADKVNQLVDDLPSYSQPQIVRCRDCEWWEK